MTEDNTDDLRVEYQQGNAAVQHRNINAATEDHPFGEEPQDFEGDMRHLIRRVADDLYSSWEATPREYLANSETACLKVQEYKESPENSLYDQMIVPDSWQPRIEVEWNKKEDKFTIQDNGIGMAAQEVDEIFRRIGRSSSRDDGGKSGQYGQGALSFVKMVGLDNAMIMTSHSRLNDDNAAYYVTLSGVEPIRGSLPEDEYGTRFQMTPQDDFDIRSAVEKYAEWMRVPVRYYEYDENGEVDFQEDWGDKALYEAYEDNRICLGIRKRGSFEAYASPDAAGRTLLLSMDIDRNDGDYSPGQHGSPFPFDIRLLDESGKVIECGCEDANHEGLMPAVRSDYEQMLVEARDPYITEGLLNNRDVIGQEVENGPNAGKMVVSEERLNSDKPLPSAHEYLPRSEVTSEDQPGNAQVIFGPNQGKVIVSEDEWNEMDEGRAKLYVPEDELSQYDSDNGTGDLQLPQPTSDRDRLQSHRQFWEYIGQQFAQQFDNKVEEVYQLIESSPDALDAIMDLNPEELVVSPAGFDS